MRQLFPQPVGSSEQALLDRVASWNGGIDNDVSPLEGFQELAVKQGCDFATAYLYHRIVSSERHAPFLATLMEERAPAIGRTREVRVAIVPGAFYQENPRTGADGRVAREIAESLGLRTVLVPIASTGTLRENAQMIVDWLRSQKGEELILVSISKGGSDVKTALADADATETFRSVIGWINLCGILDGTPMADWLLSPNWFARANRFVYRVRGRSLDFLQDLCRYPGSPLDFPLALPPQLKTVHVLGFPLRRHLTNGLARRCHDRLAPFGPNDGSLLLAESLRWPGQLCPVWGADHYLQPRQDIGPLLRALFTTIIGSGK